jgi:exodeoxyribonuclease-3
VKIATWNVNSINARLQTVLDWFREAQPDVACLQELKCVDEKFPREPFEALGYNLAVFGQKSWNGVALLSKHPLSDVRRGLPGDDADEHSRYVEAVVEAPTPVRVASIYLPNGNPTTPTNSPTSSAGWSASAPTPPASCRWRSAWFSPATTTSSRPKRTSTTGAAGPRTPSSAPSPAPPSARSAGSASPTRTSRRAAAPTSTPSGTIRPGAWERNNGIRIDHALLSPQAADRLTGFEVHRHVRGRSAEGERPSDHVPVVIELAS